jgi:hypothetical protein
MDDKPSKRFVEKCRRHNAKGEICKKQSGWTPVGTGMLEQDTKWCNGCDKTGKDKTVKEAAKCRV